MSRVLLLCWRDSDHPQGGGSERYLEHVGAHLAARGHEVVYRTALHPGSARRERRAGIDFSRAGGRLGVYPRAALAVVAGRLGLGPLRGGLFDVVIDTQNGVPYFARCFAGAPVVVLVHHCHREQWPVAGPVLGRVGWWLESRVSPRVHRGCQYVTVSGPSAAELAELGVDPRHIAVVRNGADPLPAAVPAGGAPLRAEGPHLVVLSRLVPHKHVEDAVDVLAGLRSRFPGLVLDVVGDGWWADRLRAHAARVAPPGSVVFHGHLDETGKHRVLAGAAVHLLPSRKEGWGLAVIEAAQHAVPTIGYHHASGLRDSVVDGRTGVLVDDVAAMTRVCAELLDDAAMRERMGAAARERARGYSWELTGAGMAEVLDAVAAGRRVDGELPRG